MRSLRTLIGVLLFAVVLQIAACNRTRPLDIETVTTVRETPTHLWLIQWGTSANGLEFVAFTGWPVKFEPGPAIVRPTSSSRGTKGAQLHRLDNTIVDLPHSEFQLFEFVDGAYSERAGDVTLSELQSFLAIPQDEYTIEALLEFIRSARQQASR